MKKLRGRFGENVFDKAKMKRYLDGKTYKAICQAQESGEIQEKYAEKYACALRKWALKKHVERYAHRFQPLNNCTAGKRDSLVSINQEGSAVVKFRGKELKKGEGDASSFPNGGIRQTFEARGITKWDCSSYAFVKDGCLCIPTTFVSFTGETLDKKTPLLRSGAALNKQALRLLKLTGTCCRRVFGVVGAEQEYFLIDKDMYLKRPDLMYTGRTLLGCLPPKGQQLHDHYYRPPNGKLVRFWQEVDAELSKLGIMAKTEHREVAPSQFELAPCYAPVNISNDQNQIIMETLQSVADKFDLVCLLHEKPFLKLNGSGKHNNWSLLTDTDVNLFETGDTAQEQGRFVLFLASVVRAVDKHADLLRFSVASAANDCRLGGYEAPPQIISMFLGDIYAKLQLVLNDGNWHLGKDKLPQIGETTDRNRTSPFAFTGNKFEFRMVGASASLADCNTILNTVVAESIQYFADKLQNSANFWADAQKLSSEVLAKHGKIVFDGNNYSEKWLSEAKSRGLFCASNTPQALKCLSEAQNVQLFEKLGVLSAREVAALQQIQYENYADIVLVEATTLWEICAKQIAPATNKYIAELTQLAQTKYAVDLDNTLEVSAAKKASALNRKLLLHTCKLKNYIDLCSGSAQNRAEFACEKIITQMSKVREQADNLEKICPEELWPLPTYGKLLYGSCNR